MKLNQLRKIIREEVKAAVKEELQDMLNEAVKVASNPSTAKQVVPKSSITKTSSNSNSIDNLMEQTRTAMTGNDYKQVFNGTSDMVQKPNFASMMANSMGMKNPSNNQVGLDISQFDFVKKAGKVFNASVEKDKIRQGIN